MAIHGHTIIELQDVKSGEKQVIEKDNVVTGAVAEIMTPFGIYSSAAGLFNASYSELDDFVSRFYGGLLLYDTALGASPDTVFAPATAHLTGCAGYGLKAPGQNPMRGESNLIESELDFANGTAKFVYDFGTSQANGTIASICLSSRLAGYTGAERAAGTQPSETSVRGCDYVGGLLSEEFMPWMYYADSNDLGVGSLYEVDEEKDCTLNVKLKVYPTGAKIEIRRYAALLHSVPLFWPEKEKSAPLLSTKTVDLTGQLQTNTWDKCAMNYDAQRRKIYLISMLSDRVAPNAEDWVFEIDPDTCEYTKYIVPNQTGVELYGSARLAITNIDVYVHEGVLYRRSYAQQNGIYRLFAIPLADPAAVTEIEQNGNNMQRVNYTCEGKIYSAGQTGCAVLNTADHAVYSVPVSCNSYSNNLAVVPIYGRKLLCLCNAGDGNSSPSKSGRVGIKYNYLATINDLPTPVVKTADKTMKITYILRDGS